MSFYNLKSTEDVEVNVINTIRVSTNNSTTTPLLASETFTGTADDISIYSQINFEVYGRPSTIQGDGSNAKASLFFEFSPDGTNWDISVPILVRDPGLFIPYPLINVGKYFRLRYLNDGGASAISILGLTETASTPENQTVFRLQSQFLPLATKDLARTLDQGVSGSDPVTLGRSVLMGKNPAGTYGNVGRTANSGGLDIGVTEHEVATPIKALTSFKCTQVTVTTSAVQVASTALTNRKSVSLKALTSNGASRSIFIGTTSAVTTSTGYELASGDSIDMEIDDTVAIWAIANAGTNILCVAEIAGTSTSS